MSKIPIDYRKLGLTNDRINLTSCNDVKIWVSKLPFNYLSIYFLLDSGCCQ